MSNQETTCLFCKKNKVLMRDWNKRCAECKAQIRAEEEKAEIQMGIKHRMPAAVITTEKGHRVFVDKFGEELDNPGYDLENDPRGYKHTGALPKDKPTMVI